MACRGSAVRIRLARLSLSRLVLASQLGCLSVVMSGYDQLQRETAVLYQVLYRELLD